MSKSHRREERDQEQAPREHPSSPGLQDTLRDGLGGRLDVLSGSLGDLAELWARGNQAASERLDERPQAGRGPEGELPFVVSALAERAATALCIAPRDSAWTERLLAIIERSALPAERKEVLAVRLRTDQAMADEVAQAVQTHLGSDSEALRSTLIAALERAGRQGEGSELASPAQTLSDRAEEIVVAGTATETGLEETTVRGLLRDLVLLVAFGWDEEEEGPTPGDYAAEESGW